MAILILLVGTGRADVMEWEVEKPTGKYDFKQVDLKTQAERNMARVTQYLNVVVSSMLHDQSQQTDEALDKIAAIYFMQEAWQKAYKDERYHLIQWQDFLELRNGGK